MNYRTAKLYDLEVPEHLKEALDTDETDLKAEFVRVPGDVAYWGARAADALHIQLEAENARKRAEAELLLEYRERFAADGKKATLDVLDASVQSDPRLISARAQETRAVAQAARFKAFAFGVSAKKDMLMLLGGFVRDERKADPAILGRE